MPSLSITGSQLTGAEGCTGTVGPAPVDVGVLVGVFVGVLVGALVGVETWLPEGAGVKLPL